MSLISLALRAHLELDGEAQQRRPEPLLVRGADDLREDRAPEAGAQRGDAAP